MAIEALIFDLDDTLFDTFGQLVQPASREACAAMIASGLSANLDQALAMREALFLAHPRADLFALMVETLGVHPGRDPKRVRDSGHQAYFGREVESHIRLDPRTRALLQELQQDYAMWLVTAGTPRTQARKVLLLELDRHFREVHYVDGELGQTKRDAFATILSDHKLHPARVVCIGDRPDREILAGNQLGMVTVRIHGGEFHHLQPQLDEERAHHDLREVSELAALLARYRT